MTNEEMIREMERDFASRFIAEQYVSDGYGNICGLRRAR